MPPDSACPPSFTLERMARVAIVSKPNKEELQDRKKRLIVEFAIENAQVVKRRKDKELKSREQSKTKNTAAKEPKVQESKQPPNKKRKRLACVFCL